MKLLVTFNPIQMWNESGEFVSFALFFLFSSKLKLIKNSSKWAQTKLNSKNIVYLLCTKGIPFQAESIKALESFESNSRKRFNLTVSYTWKQYRWERFFIFPRKYSSILSFPLYFCACSSCKTWWDSISLSFFLLSNTNFK